MASSGDYSFNPSTYDIITGALRLIGAIQTGEVPPPEEYDDALSALNGLIHAWQASGMHVWTQTTYALTLVPGQNSYQIGIGAPDLNEPRPLRVTEARLLAASDKEPPLIPMSRWDYANLSNKHTPQGPPVEFFYDPQLPYGAFTVAPTPAAAAVVNFIGQRPLQTFDTQRDTADVPQEWISALRFSLALELGPEYDVPAERMKIIKDLVDEKIAVVKTWDTEPLGTSPLPFTQAVYQLIAGALRLCGGCGPQEIPTLGLVNNGLYALNAMIQSWQAMNMHVWTQETISFSTIAAQGVYTIGTGGNVSTVQRPLRVSGARRIAGTTVTPLIPMSRWDVANLSPTPDGPPANYFYDPKQPPLGALSLIPAPDAVYTVNLTAQRPLQTFADLTGTADFPDEWMAALRYNLALAMWHEHAERRATILKNPAFSDYAGLKQLADDSLAIVRQWDAEPQGTTTLPFSQPVYQLIAGALRLCGGCGAQETPTIGLVNNGFYSLNAMVKEWQGRNIRVWQQRDATLFLQPGQRVYKIGVGSPDHCCASDSWNQTFLTVAGNAADTTITVNLTTGISVADHIAVLLDATPTQLQQYFWTTVATITPPNTLTLAAGLPSGASSGARVVSYTNDLVRPLKVPAGRRMVYAGNLGTPTRIETPLSVFSRIDYSFQTNKDNPGQITGYWFDPQLGFAEISTWMTPEDANQAMMFTAQMPLALYTDLTTVGNFPDEWQNAIRYCLAVELWPEHAERRAAIKGDYNVQLVKAQADDKLMIAQGWDREPESVYFGLQRYTDARNT